MITEEQIKYHCKDQGSSAILFATLTRDYKSDKLNYILPEGLLVRIRLFGTGFCGLYLDNGFIDFDFPLDAAELLE